VDSAVFAASDSAFAYTLVVRWLRTDTIDFRMDITDRANGSRRQVAGRAGGELDVDPEEDTDDASGLAYESREYDYTRGDCSLELRIDLENNPPTRAATSGADGCGPGLADWSPTLRRTAGSYRWPASADGDDGDGV
jgi:hypothetical protein